MDLNDYAAWTAKTARIPPSGTRARQRLSYLGLGLAGEAGEVADHVKKLLRDGEDAWNPDEVSEQLGDLIYYWAAMCIAVGRSPADVLLASRSKIEVRVARRSR